LILREGNVDGAVQHVHHTVSNLLQRRVNLYDLIITKGYTKPAAQYKNKQPHIEVALRMDIPVGNRIPYVVVNKGKGARTWECAQHPAKQLQGNTALPIDVDYYLNKQLRKPLIRIFSPIFGNDQKAAQQLFEGPHMKERKQATPRGEITRYFGQPKHRCMVCRAACGSSLLCPQHQSQRGTMEAKLKQQYSQAALRRESAWSQCGECIGSDRRKDQERCQNYHCRNLYTRHQTDLDIEDLGNKLASIKRVNP